MKEIKLEKKREIHKKGKKRNIEREKVHEKRRIYVEKMDEDNTFSILFEKSFGFALNK